MRNPLFGVVEQKYQRSNPIGFEIGENVVVTLKISEGGKERLQDFAGTVIARRGSGLDEMFTVRRLVGNEGVERTFPMHSPKIISVKATRTGKVRRAKLYYLRERVGKARRLKELRLTREQRALREKASAAKGAKAAAVRDAQEAVAAAKSGSEEMAASAT